MNVELLIIDTHIHLGYCPRFSGSDVSLKNMITLMDKNNIRCVLGSHIAGINSNHFEYANLETLKAIKDYPQRIFGYVIYDPVFPRESLDDTKKNLDRKGFVGIKIYPTTHRHGLDGDRYTPIWEHANERNIPILTHTWDAVQQDSLPYDPAAEYAQPKLLETVLRKYTDLKVIMAHGGAHYNGHLQAIEIVKKYRNAFIDISGDTITFGLIEWFVKEIGAERILYGSDMNWLDPRAHIGRILGANISYREKEMILYENAAKLFCM